MSSIINRLARFIPFTGGRRMMGKDLEGNKYYEMPNPAGGRMKRVVKYKIIAHISEYTNGSRQRIPVQWTAWLSHTRPDPPSIEELTKDAQRLSRLQPMIAAIEEREREERIRQGYLKEGAPKQVHAALADRSFQPAPVLSLPTPRSHSGSRSPSENRPGAPAASESSVERNQHPASSTVSQSPHLQSNPWPAASAATNPNMPLTSKSKQTTGQEYQVPTPTSPSVPPQGPTVDPMKHASKEELRKLSEEDTKRRIAEGGLDPHPVNDPDLTGGGNPEPVSSTPLQPRRRGGK